ncbi:MAG: hypothetical protein IRZ00_17250 [Gemmatimonadetes bacterium]|nr:hypothetical protein [Gemmatimonadota bacterium]
MSCRKPPPPGGAEPPRPGGAEPPPRPAPPAGGPVCDLCGATMYELHCKLICPACGYTRDCSDP